MLRRLMFDAFLQIIFDTSEAFSLDITKREGFCRVLRDFFVKYGAFLSVSIDLKSAL